MTDNKQARPKLSDAEKEANWQARKAKMTPERRAKAEARRTENARKQAAKAKKQLEEVRAAKAPAAPPRKGALARLLGGGGGAEIQALQSKVGRLEKELGTVKTDLKEALKGLKKLQRQFDRGAKRGSSKTSTT